MSRSIWTKFFPALALFATASDMMHAEPQPGSTLPATARFESGETQATLIELFTSEGCSSCPPADAWISRLKSDPNLWKVIVPLVFHVDYWDRLGWRDRFAKPEFTQRQWHYASSWASGTVYTPAFVVNGKEWPGFLNREALPTARSEKVGTLAVALKGNEAAATFSSENSLRGPLKLDIALLGTNLQSDVKRGENSGRKLHHDFVVLHLTNTEMTNQGNRWTGTVLLSNNTETDKPAALAAWIKSVETDLPIQATGGWLKP